MMRGHSGAHPTVLGLGAALALVLFCAAGSAEKVARPIADVVAAVEARRASTAAPDLRELSTDLVRVNEAGEIQVYVVLTAFRPEYVTRLEGTGVRIEFVLPEFRLVQGWVAAARIADVARFEFVAEVRPPGYPVRRPG